MKAMFSKIIDISLDVMRHILNKCRPDKSDYLYMGRHASTLDFDAFTYDDFASIDAPAVPLEERLREEARFAIEPHYAAASRPINRRGIKIVSDTFPASLRNAVEPIEVTVFKQVDPPQNHGAAGSNEGIPVLHVTSQRTARRTAR
jgi:hypothetical protein